MTSNPPWPTRWYTYTPACRVLSVPEALTCQQPVAGLVTLRWPRYRVRRRSPNCERFCWPTRARSKPSAYETSGAWRIGRVGERSSRAYGGCWGWGSSNHRPAPPRPAQGPCQQGTGQGGRCVPRPNRGPQRHTLCSGRSPVPVLAAGCLHPDASGAAHTVLRGRPGGQAFR